MSKMSLVKHNIEELDGLESLIPCLSVALYSKPLGVLTGASIGQHIRHILEFYSCLKKGFKAGLVSYDDRERNLLLETKPIIALHLIGDLKVFLSSINEDSSLTIKACYSENASEFELIESSLYRELAYTLDHTVHHMAIVKIALSNEKIILGANIGVAASTIRYRKECAQ
jgi:hypothetical protein